MNTAVAIAVIAGTAIALASLVLYARSSAQAAEALRRQEIADEVKKAVDPIAADRDYWRGLATEQAAELRRRS